MWRGGVGEERAARLTIGVIFGKAVEDDAEFWSRAGREELMRARQDSYRGAGKTTRPDWCEGRGGDGHPIQRHRGARGRDDIDEVGAEVTVGRTHHVLV